MKDKLLFTPGPLTTSAAVKEAMLRDLGSRDKEFIKIVAEIRNSLLDLAYTTKEDGYEAVLMQGAGTFGVESVISSAVPPESKIIIMTNGAYGKRMVKICKIYGIDIVELEYNEDEPICAADIEEAMEEFPDATHLAAVHCETTTGIINPVKDIGEYAAKHKLVYIVDAMSSFGAYKIDVHDCHIDFLVSSANKCIEGVPGFSFIIANRELMQHYSYNKQNLSLNLHEQWIGLEADGQFRFTPPVHSLAAFRQALKELAEEGGVAGRARRYSENHKALTDGMRRLGFEEYIPQEYQSYIITTYLFPEMKDRKFDFREFYEFLNEKGYVIYPGKLSKEDCFRIGNIGRLYKKDIEGLVNAIEEWITI